MKEFGFLQKLIMLEKMMGVDFIPRKIRELRQSNSDGKSDKIKEFDKLRRECLSCCRCPLYRTRTNVVFGVGSIESPIVFVGEAPGEEEDKQAEPFVGRAGQYLTRTLLKFGVTREQVYITNIVKCRPPANRAPIFEEIVACIPYLWKQIKLISPQIICALGGVAASSLLDKKVNITSARGTFSEKGQYKIFCAFHPSFIIRGAKVGATFESDIHLVLKTAGLIK